MNEHKKAIWQETLEVYQDLRNWAYAKTYCPICDCKMPHGHEDNCPIARLHLIVENQ